MEWVTQESFVELDLESTAPESLDGKCSERL